MSNAATIRRIANLNVPVEAMREMFLVLAEQLERDEARKASHAAAQKRHRVGRADITVTSQCNHSEITPRALDNIPSLESKEERNPPISPPLSKPLPSEPEGFAAFWALYPKRDGTADRKGAVKAFGPALKRVDLETLLDATRAYAADMKAKGKVGTEFVKQARSWLNGDLWTEYQPTPVDPSAVKPVPVIIGTPAWAAWIKIRKRAPEIDIRMPDGQIKRGWYFPTEFPEQSPDRSPA